MLFGYTIYYCAVISHYVIVLLHVAVWNKVLHYVVSCHTVLHNVVLCGDLCSCAALQLLYRSHHCCWTAQSHHHDHHHPADDAHKELASN